jgi:hypothetical protein
VVYLPVNAFPCSLLINPNISIKKSSRDHKKNMQPAPLQARIRPPLRPKAPLERAIKPLPDFPASVVGFIKQHDPFRVALTILSLAFPSWQLTLLGSEPSGPVAGLFSGNRCIDISQKRRIVLNKLV